MVSAPTLDIFLTGAKQALRNAVKNKQPVMLVLGNEEADLDSCTSAILFAYLRTASPPKGAFSKIYIPLINNERSSIAGDELFSRVLPHASMKEDHFITIDDLVHHGSTRSGLTEDTTRFFLVNQNVMLGRENQNYSHNVAGCIDNHEDQGYVPMDVAPEPRIIGKAASCTSLVVNWGQSTWESLDVTERKTSEGHLAKLALAAILVETQNLEDSNVVRNEDVLAVDFLVSRISANDSSFDRHAFYSAITSKKPQRPAAPRQASSRQPFFVDTSPVSQVQPRSGDFAPIQSSTIVETEPVVESISHVETAPLIESTRTIDTPTNTVPSTTTALENLSVVDSMPTTTPNYTSYTVPTTNYYVPRYLSDILTESYHGPTISGAHQIGVVHTSTDLAQLVAQAERDLVNRAIAEATSGVTSSSSAGTSITTATGTTTESEPDPTQTSRILKGTPFTSALHSFATERGLSILAIATSPSASTSTSSTTHSTSTSTSSGNEELFLWALHPALSAFVPSFAAEHGEKLGLRAWGKEDDAVVLEAGMSGGRMGAFSMTTASGVGVGVGADELAGLIKQSLERETVV